VVVKITKIPPFSLPKSIGTDGLLSWPGPYLCLRGTFGTFGELCKLHQ